MYETEVSIDTEFYTSYVPHACIVSSAAVLPADIIMMFTWEGYAADTLPFFLSAGKSATADFPLEIQRFFHPLHFRPAWTYPKCGYPMYQ